MPANKYASGRQHKSFFMNNPLEKIIPGITAIARQAGAAILDIYNSGADFGVEAKSDDSPLTKADRASNAVICSALEVQFPEIPIVSEENKAIPYTERVHFTQCWMIDPLDGTKEFVQRNGEFTINIALIEAGMPVLGVMYVPVLDEMYWAVKGAGAWMDAGNGVQPLHALEYSDADSGLKLVCSRSHMNEATTAFVNQYREPELVSRGSALKFMLIAKGEAHLYPRLAPTMEWDTAAAQIILEEAGGQVLHAQTGKPLVYNKENLLNPEFVAYGKVKGEVEGLRS